MKLQSPASVSLLHISCYLTFAIRAHVPQTHQSFPVLLRSLACPMKAELLDPEACRRIAFLSFFRVLLTSMAVLWGWGVRP